MRRPDGAESQCRTERVRRGCGEGVEGVEGAQGTAGAVASVGLAGCGVYFNQDRDLRHLLDQGLDRSEGSQTQ